MILSYMSAGHKIIEMAKDTKKMIDEDEIAEDNYTYAAAIMLNYDKIPQFSSNEKLTAISLLTFLKAVFRYVKSIKGIDYIALARGNVRDGSKSSSFGIGPVTSEALETESKIKDVEKTQLIADVRHFYARERDHP